MSEAPLVIAPIDLLHSYSETLTKSQETISELVDSIIWLRNKVSQLEQENAALKSKKGVRK